MRIYNLFPLLAGRFTGWHTHMDRAASMGFDWIFVNPVQQPGMSGSLYSIRDYFGLNPLLVDAASDIEPTQQLRDAIEHAQGQGMHMMTDLVINHCAVDSPLIGEHPEWFKWSKKGKVAHPWCMDGKRKVVWGDLARFDHKRTSDPDGLYTFVQKIIGHLVSLGFRGFRCDAAYQLPTALWERLITDTKARHGDIVFAAETLGCTHEQTMETARAGFDFIFNSSKWWDFKDPWLLEQHNESRLACPSISFPESHDTLRLAEEFNGNMEAICQRYLFSACFSTGVMMPMGFEFGFRKRPHVVKTRPSDWPADLKDTDTDLSGYIKEVNALKARLHILNEDPHTEMLETDEDDVLMMLKRSETDGSSMLIIMNCDVDNPVELLAESPGTLMGTDALVSDVTPGKYTPVDTSGPLAITLEPARSIVLYSPVR